VRGEFREPDLEIASRPRIARHDAGEQQNRFFERKHARAEGRRAIEIHRRLVGSVDARLSRGFAVRRNSG
jgi:hypothetical protein